MAQGSRPATYFFAATPMSWSDQFWDVQFKAKVNAKRQNKMGNSWKQIVQRRRFQVASEESEEAEVGALISQFQQTNREVILKQSLSKQLGPLQEKHSK